MVRPRRIAKGGLVYHVLNRANGRLRIFRKVSDFEAFENIVAQSAERIRMRICGYCIMSNHWHLILWPRQDGDLSDFMKWLTVTHSHRWHQSHGTVGIGHLYQGRFKSFPVQTNAYYLTLMKYVESNPRRCGMVKRSSDWPWSSLVAREGLDKPIVLSEGPMALPRRWSDIVDERYGTSNHDSKLIETCIQRGRPLGDEAWTKKMAGKLGLLVTIRPKGRPVKEPKKGVCGAVEKVPLILYIGYQFFMLFSSMEV